MTCKMSPVSTTSTCTAIVLFCACTLLATFCGAVGANDDVCQCGPRCQMYEEEIHCTRCCTSVMRRRSIPDALLARIVAESVALDVHRQRRRRTSRTTAEKTALAPIEEEEDRQQTVLVAAAEAEAAPILRSAKLRRWTEALLARRKRAAEAERL